MRNQCAPLLPADVIARAERLNVPLLLDGLKAAKIEIPGGGCMAMEIMPVERGMKVVGTAMTCLLYTSLHLLFQTDGDIHGGPVGTDIVDNVVEPLVAGGVGH